MITLYKNYKGYLSGTVVQLQSSEEATLIAQRLAIDAGTTAPTSGAVTANTIQGRCAVPAGSSSVVITNALVDATSKIFAVVAQAAADGTLLRVERVVPAAGSFTIYGTANATADTVIDWLLLNPSGLTQTH